MAFNQKTGLFEGFIYKIFNDVNRKIYIGQTIKTIEERWKEHKYNVRKKKSLTMPIYGAMLSIGIDHFNIELVEKYEATTQQELKDLLNSAERQYIADYNCRQPNGYNKALGGVSRGNTFPPKNVYQYSFDGNLVAVHESVSLAARIVGCSQADISNCCNAKKVKSVAGYVWSFTALDKLPARFANSKARPDQPSVPIYQFSLDGVLLNVFQSLDDAATHVVNSRLTASEHVPLSSVRQHLRVVSRGKPTGQDRCYYSNEAYGYLWGLSDDPSLLHRAPPFRNEKPVNCYSLDWQLICTYPSRNSAIRSAGLKSTRSIDEACKNPQRTAAGCHWRNAC